MNINRLLFLAVLAVMTPAFAQQKSTQPQDSTTELFKVIDRGDKWRVAQELISTGIDVNAVNGRGQPILILMSGSSFVRKMDELVDAVRLLLDKGADVNKKTPKGHTALMAAASRGNKEIVKLLLDRGADIGAESEDGDDAISAAVSGGYVEILTMLFEKNAGVSISEKKQQSYLFKAISSASVNTVKFFIDRKYDPNSGIFYAVQRGYPGVLALLLDNGGNVNMRDINGNTPLINAVLYENEEAVRVLLVKGADKNISNSEGATALTLAKKNQQSWERSAQKGYEYQKKNLEILPMLEGTLKVDETDIPGALYKPKELIEEAINGIPSQRFMLGRIYYYGLRGVPQSFTEAYYWFAITTHDIKNALDMRDPQMQTYYKERAAAISKLDKEAAIKEMRIMMVDPYVIKSTPVFLKTLEQKLSPEVRESVQPRINAWKKEHPLDIDPNMPEARKVVILEQSAELLTPKAEAGDKQAQYLLGKCLLSTLCEFPNEEMQRRIDHRALQEKRQEGQGTKKFDNDSIQEEDRKAAELWIQKAAAQGYEPAIMMLEVNKKRPANIPFSDFKRK